MRWRAFTIVWMGIVCIVSLLPPGLGGRGGGIWHLLGYGILTVLLTGWLPPATSAAAAWGYGAVLEAVQWLTPYRDADASDLLLNAAGVAGGVLVWAALRWNARR